MSVFLNSLSCSVLNLKSKFFFLITTLVPGPEKRELSQHPSAELGCPALAHVFSFRRPQLSPCCGWAVTLMTIILWWSLVWHWTDKSNASHWTVSTTCLRDVIFSVVASILMTPRTENEILWAGALLRVKLNSLRAQGSGRAQNEPGTSSHAGKWPASSAMAWVKQASTSLYVQCCLKKIHCLFCKE